MAALGRLTRALLRGGNRGTFPGHACGKDAALVREGLGRNRAVQERREFLEPLAIGDVDHQQVIGPVL